MEAGKAEKVDRADLLKNSDEKAFKMEEGIAPAPPTFQRAKSSRDAKPKGAFLPVTSHVYLQNEHLYQGDHTKELRAGFIRKVYGLLSFQMIVTIGICVLCMYNDGMREYILDHVKGCYYGFMIAMIISLIGCMCCKDVVPLNFGWFTAFTVFMGFYLGIVCAIYKEAGYAILILEALILTTGLFAGLTLFTCLSGKDFSGMGVYLFAGLWIFSLWTLLMLIFGFTANYVYLLFGIVLFSGYVIYDTNNIMRKLGYDDYIIAAIELYLDFINLFLLILRALSGSSRN